MGRENAGSWRINERSPSGWDKFEWWEPDAFDPEAPRPTVPDAVKARRRQANRRARAARRRTR